MPGLRVSVAAGEYCSCPCVSGRPDRPILATLRGARELVKNPAPLAAIFAGIGMIYFVIVSRVMGIFTWRSGWESHAVTAANEPRRFSFAVTLTLIVGSAFIIWGLYKSIRR
ncbi:MAG TPA: hypothetical protein VJ808_12215 [Gemmatimonadales bacterium]|nr:hypothetical protein [Gemmatimonadales bacterium]